MSDVAPGAGRGLYARLWRWHFFTALIVVPFVLWQSLTGLTYLWRDELSALLYPDLVRVSPATAPASLDAQLASVLVHHPAHALAAIEVPADAARATVFQFGDRNGLTYPAFVDPQGAAYLGSVPSTRWPGGISRGLHGGWPISPWGSYLLEVGACWAVVMILTGLYLWWPRQRSGWAGVLYPRLKAGSRLFWRDLHAVVGVYIALVALAFLFTALPWTTFWGGEVLGRVQRATGQESPNGFYFAPGRGATQVPDGVRALGLDELVAVARAAGARGTLEIQPATAGSPVKVRDDHARAPDEVWLQLDARTGAVLTRVSWQQFPALPRLIAYGVDLHEGTYFGRVNQLFNTLVALALVWLSVTGFMGWYRRRPPGEVAAPPRRPVRYPAALGVVAVALCLVLPLFGASVLFILLLDRIAGGLLPSRRPAV